MKRRWRGMMRRWRGMMRCSACAPQHEAPLARHEELLRSMKSCWRGMMRHFAE
jgi:hypothetical protein